MRNAQCIRVYGLIKLCSAVALNSALSPVSEVLIWVLDHGVIFHKLGHCGKLSIEFLQMELQNLHWLAG